MKKNVQIKTSTVHLNITECTSNIKSNLIIHIKSKEKGSTSNTIYTDD